MNIEQMREEFENSPRFKGMDFTRSANPEYYESPYANGALDGWIASRAELVVELPDPADTLAGPSLYKQFKEAIEAAGVKVKP